MPSYKIRLDKMQDAQEFASIASGIDGRIELHDNSGFVVNAKSLIGVIYSLEFSETFLVMDGSHYMKFKRFIIED